MKTLLRYAVVLAGVYLVAWAAAYVVIVVIGGESLDFSHFFEYLGLAWTFRGGELPVFIWLFSIIAFLPLAGLAVFLLRRYGSHKNAG